MQRNIQMSLEMSEEEWEKAVRDFNYEDTGSACDPTLGVGVFDFKRLVSPFTSLHPFDKVSISNGVKIVDSAKSQFFYYYDYDLSSYGERLPRNLIRYDDPGNISYALTAKARGMYLDTEVYTPNETLYSPWVGNNEWGVVMGNNLVNKGIKKLTQKDWGLKVAAGIYSFLTTLHSDDSHDKAVIDWAWNNSSRFISEPIK